jgi:hypothetical protein
MKKRTKQNKRASHRSKKFVDRIEYDEARYRLEQFFTLLLQADKNRLNKVLKKEDTGSGWRRTYGSGQSILDKIYGKNPKFQDIKNTSKPS